MISIEILFAYIYVRNEIGNAKKGMKQKKKNEKSRCAGNVVCLLLAHIVFFCFVSRLYSCSSSKLRRLKQLNIRFVYEWQLNNRNENGNAIAIAIGVEVTL